MSVPSISITLSGKEYPIPKLAVRQLRIIVPAATRLLKELGPVMMVALGARENPDSVNPMAMLEGLEVTDKMFDDLIDVLWPAIAKGTPSFKRDDLLDMDVGIKELMDALPIVFKQTGIIDSQPAKGDEPGAGASGEEAAPVAAPA